jgi:hypothetical protein
LFQAYSSEGEKGDSHQEENKNGSLYIEWSNSIAQSNKKKGKISKGQGAVTRRITEFVWLWSGETHSYGWTRKLEALTADGGGGHTGCCKQCDAIPEGREMHREGLRDETFRRTENCMQFPGTHLLWE